MPFDPRELDEVLAADLENLRASRYRSEEQAIELGAFGVDDQGRIRETYAFLRTVASRLEDRGRPDALSGFVTFAEQLDISAVTASARSLGTDVTDPRLAAALHDIRGGTLTPLLLQLTRVQRGGATPEYADTLEVAARDHMKIMRNVVQGLDPEARERDLLRVPHTVGELAAALRHYAVTVGERTVVANVSARSPTSVIAETCVECAAVDRVAYNLMNNAAAHAAADDIAVFLAPVGGNLRVVVTNEISGAQREALRSVIADSPAALYDTYSTTGSGYGLRIVADLVGRAYGISSVPALLSSDHLGIRLFGDAFVTWFHWPLSAARE